MNYDWGVLPVHGSWFAVHNSEFIIWDFAEPGFVCKLNNSEFRILNSEL